MYLSEDINFVGGIGIWCERAYIVQINYKVNTVVRIGNDVVISNTDTCFLCVWCVHSNCIVDKNARISNDVVICNTDVCFLDSQLFYQLFFISPGFFMF